MRLRVLSDLHIDLAGEMSIPRKNYDLVLLAGDIHGGFEKPTLGNGRI